MTRCRMLCIVLILVLTVIASGCAGGDHGPVHTRDHGPVPTRQSGNQLYQAVVKVCTACERPS
jgi:hypothetical protein